MRNLRTTSLAASVVVALFALVACSTTNVTAPETSSATNTGERAAIDPAEAKEKEALATAVSAYVYGYPLVAMELTRRVATNVEKPEGTRAPMGQFARMREFPLAGLRTELVPDHDALWTIAWLDVSKEPWIVVIPDLKGRYALFSMLDGWTGVFQASSRRTSKAGAWKYAITGPGWAGPLPAGVTELKAPTGLVWILGRIFCTGTGRDSKAVNALQDQISARPLSAYGKRYTPAPGRVDPAIDMKTPVRDQVNKLDAASYFRLLAELIKTNPPYADDAPMVARLAGIGIVPGQEFDLDRLDPAVAKGVRGAVSPAQEEIAAWLRRGSETGDSKLENGWSFSLKTGTYGVNYVLRAFTAAVALGASLPQDTVFATSQTDADGEPYDGTKKYVMRFEKGQMPPVNGSWSLTMYSPEYFLYANPLKRQALSESKKLLANPDGSVDLFIQHGSPGKNKESNWLPAPAGKFILTLRLYWPKEAPPSILDGSWKIPAVKKAP